LPSVSASTLSDNFALGGGGGIDNEGTLAVSGCTLSGNSSGGGGGIANYAALTISGSTVSGNSATGGGGILNWYGGTLTVTGCTLSNNSAGIDGGGAIFNNGELAVTISNSMFCNNSPDNIVGLYTDGGGNTFC
jgi:hypothetical protein